MTPRVIRSEAAAFSLPAQRRGGHDPRHRQGAADGHRLFQPGAPRLRSARVENHVRLSSGWVRGRAHQRSLGLAGSPSGWQGSRSGVPVPIVAMCPVECPGRPIARGMRSGRYVVTSDPARVIVPGCESGCCSNGVRLRTSVRIEKPGQGSASRNRTSPGSPASISEDGLGCFFGDPVSGALLLASECCRLCVPRGSKEDLGQRWSPCRIFLTVTDFGGRGFHTPWSAGVSPASGSPRRARRPRSRPNCLDQPSGLAPAGCPPSSVTVSFLLLRLNTIISFLNLESRKQSDPHAAPRFAAKRAPVAGHTQGPHGFGSLGNAEPDAATACGVPVIYAKGAENLTRRAARDLAGVERSTTRWGRSVLGFRSNERIKG